jgi:hypothetical protein
MGPRWRIALAVVAITVCLAAVPSSAGAFGPNGGTEAATVSVPASGTGEIATSDLPPKADQASVDVEPANGNVAVNLFFALAVQPDLHARLVTCISVFLASRSPKGGSVNKYTLNDPSLAVLFLNACIELAVEFSQPSGPAPAADAAAGCTAPVIQTPIQITRVSGQYSATAGGKVSKPRRAPLLVSCRRHGRGFVLKLRPRARHRTLRQVVGRTLGLGFANHGTHAVGVRAAFSVN